MDIRSYGRMDIRTYGHTDIRTDSCPTIDMNVRFDQRTAVSPYVRMSVCPYVHMSVCPYVRISTCAYIGHFTSLRLIINIKVLYHSKCSISTFPDAKILNIESYSAMINKFVGETSAVESR